MVGHDVFFNFAFWSRKLSPQAHNCAGQFSGFSYALVILPPPRRNLLFEITQSAIRQIEFLVVRVYWEDIRWNLKSINPVAQVFELCQSLVYEGQPVRKHSFN
jgi:hypothetical protein